METLLPKLGILIVIFSVISPISYADIVIVTNPDNPMLDLDTKELKKIFLGVKRRTEDGFKISIIDQYENKEIRKNFYENLTGKTVAQINSRWAGLLFAGKGTPPNQVESDLEVKKWIQENKLGFGYIHSDQLDSSVKKIAIVPSNQ